MPVDAANSGRNYNEETEREIQLKQTGNDKAPKSEEVKHSNYLPREHHVRAMCQPTMCMRIQIVARLMMRVLGHTYAQCVCLKHLQ